MADIIKNDCQGETFNINTWPETIWLQNENGKPFSSSMFGEICWCHEQVYEDDVAYVRDDIASAAVKAIRGAELSRLRSELEEAREIITDCQQRLASYLPPDSGISPEQCISNLLEILDGPRARASLKRSDKTERGCQVSAGAKGDTVSREGALQASAGGDAYTASLIESLIRRDAWITNERLEAIAQNSEDAEDICSLLKPNTALAILSARSFLLNRHVRKIEERSDQVSPHGKATPDTK